MVIKGVRGNYSGQEIPLRESLIFGRSSQGCDVRFPDNIRGISRTHCKIENVGGMVTITDMKSSYGTFLNGRKLMPYTPVNLKPGDTFYLGDENNMFSVMGPSAPMGAMPGGAVTPMPPQQRPASSGSKGAVIAVTTLLLLAAVAAVVFFVFFAGGVDLQGTWDVVGEPGCRMTFADDGTLLITRNGGFEYTGGQFTYTGAGQNKVCLKYTSTTGKSAGGNASIDIGFLGAGAGTGSLVEMYSQGVVLNYKKGADGTVAFSDVNGNVLFMLARDSRKLGSQ